MRWNLHWNVKISDTFGNCSDPLEWIVPTAAIGGAVVFMTTLILVVMWEQMVKGCKECSCKDCCRECCCECCCKYYCKTNTNATSTNNSTNNVTNANSERTQNQNRQNDNEGFSDLNAHQNLAMDLQYTDLTTAPTPPPSYSMLYEVGHR